jgi:DivIVA domain-containing protein
VNGDEVRDTWFLRSGSQYNGYDASEVDDLLRRVAAELDAGRLAGPLIEHAVFRQRWRKRNTYDVDAVDWFLDQLILRAGDADLAGSSDDPWRDLAVAQCTQSGGSEPAPGDRKDRVKRKCFAKECEDAWRDFGRQPGMYLRWGRARRGRCGDDRYELRTAEQQTIASLYLGKLPSTLESFAGASLGDRSFTKMGTRAARSLSPGIAEIGGSGRWAPFYSRSKPAVPFVDEAGIPILYTGGRSFDGSAASSITFPGQRWLRFLVRGTRKGNAIMTAVDQAGNRVARYRRSAEGWGSVEIAVHPDRDLADELVLAIAISARWLGSYFKSD